MSGDSQLTFRLKHCLEYWNELRGEQALPPRASFNPARVAPLLSRVMLLEHKDGDLYFRIVGGLVQEFIPEKLHGKRLSDIEGSKHLTELIDKVIEEKKPRVDCRPFVSAVGDTNYQSIELVHTLVLPFGDQNGVSHVIVFHEYIDRHGDLVE